MTCQTPRPVSRRWESTAGRFKGCAACGGDLCVQCQTAHLPPSDERPEWDDNNTCDPCMAEARSITGQ